jgi:hypothetical protein
MALARRMAPTSGPAASSIPAWVEALRAPSGDLPLVASWWAGQGASAGGLHWVSGTGIVACADLYHQDAVFWGHFDPTTDVTLGSGLGAPLNRPADAAEPVMNAAFVTPLFATLGFTQVRYLTVPATGSTTLTFGAEFADYPDYNTDIYNSWIAYLNNTPGFTNTVFNAGGSSVATPNVTTSGAHKVAWSMTPTYCGFSLDGAAKTDVGGIVYPPGAPPTTIAVQANSTNAAGVPTPTNFGFVSKDVYYPPQPSADLHLLSA